MGNGKKEKKHEKAARAAENGDPGHGGSVATVATEPEPLTNKMYEKELRKLHVELVKLQEWVKHKGLKVCIVFEGRDGAGKGGTIKAITERVSPRVFRVVALPAPTEREKSQMYAQRYVHRRQNGWRTRTTRGCLATGRSSRESSTNNNWGSCTLSW